MILRSHYWFKSNGDVKGWIATGGIFLVVGYATKGLPSLISLKLKLMKMVFLDGEVSLENPLSLTN